MQQRIWFKAGFAVVAGMTALAGFALAQGGRGPQPLKVHAIKEGKLYWIEGGGGNSGVIIGDNGVIVVDAKTTPAAGKQLVDEVAKLTPKPITTVILTHSDGDHTNGLAGFPEGINIIAHLNNKREQQMQPLYAAVEVDGGKCLPPADRLPNKLVMGEKAATKIEGINFQFYHFGPAHTSGDLVVFLPDDKLVFAGDLITTSVLVHFEKEGSIDGWFTNAKGMLALNADTYIGGHATEPDTKETLKKRMAEYQAQKDQVDAMVKQGKSLEEVHMALGEPQKRTAGCRGILYMTFGENEYWAQKYRDEALK